ncbi:hypothetical protein BC343_28435 [Mucilaginibacter pedocola]|uniref:Uncharacterized protein n=1 Tax=Mucilaginibacter pedocola TaxID=1792845 RepID=A0A1S9PE74_9SPHI|nr:hypothetical protein BC343_28435 [Mucilaginibacter pedocola]
MVGYEVYDSLLGLFEAGSIKYDSHKTPFSMVSGYNPLLFGISFLGGWGVNNVVDFNGMITSYVYNEEGFPTSASVINVRVEKATITYTYITR